MVRDTKLYDIMEIKPEADETEIKKAYKKLSFKWHPDKNQDNKEKATAKFQEISEAYYSILSDPAQRERYNNEGYESMKNNNGGMPNFNPQDIFNQFFGGGGGMPGMPSFFSGMGGGMPGFFGGQQEAQNTMEHCSVEQEVSLEDLFSMKTITVNYKQKNYCKKCNGNGTKDGSVSKCNGCKGSGKKVQVVQRGNMIQQMIGNCNECNGSGEMASASNKCDECKGNKFLVKDKSIDIQVNKSIMHGNKMVMEQKGNVYKNAKTNLIITIKEKPHPLFKRNGKDLHYNMKLRLFQSLFGFTKNVVHLDGRNLIVKYNSINKFETILKIKNEGMGGDLYIHVTTGIPNLEKLDEMERTALKKLLIKTNMTEYTKETNLNTKAPANSFIVSNIEEISGEVEEEEQQPEQQEGVQCAQQ